MNFSDNSEKVILKVAADLKNFGKIIDVNNSIGSLLNFNRNDILNQDLGIILPNIINSVHNHLMMNIYEDEERYSQIEKTTFAVDKSGFLVQINLIAKVSPLISKGVHMVMIFKENEDSNKVLLISFKLY